MQLKYPSSSTQGMNGTFHSNGGDADRALNHLDPGMLRSENPLRC